ncbi:MAG: IS66 family transposase [Betaproteobacteria bacterium]|nr:IS66 family transposase [Betaproteobacteria bacterium]
MNDESDRLRAENDRLTAELAKRDGELAKQNEAIAKQNEAIAKLQHYLRRLLRGRFGRATEKLIGIPATDQSLIAEIEAFLAEDRAAPSTTPATPPAGPAASAANDSSPAGPASTPSIAVDQTASAAAKRGSRQRPSATFPNLEVRENVVDVPAAQRLDSSGAAMIRCGDQVVETVVFTKPEVFIERVTYARYRSVGDLDGDGRAATAGVPVPERIVDGGMLADQTVQAIVIGKFADALPANRTLEIMARAGCRLSGSVLDAAVAAMGDLLTPLACEIRNDLRCAPVVGVDAAMMRCRDPDLRRKCRRTPIYTVTDGTQAWYHWAPDETHRHAADVVAGFFHWLITDGWPGWRGSTSIGARLAGCWAHARRPYARIEEIDVDAATMVRLVHDLYVIEERADAAEVSLDERRRLRRAWSRPIVECIRAFALELDRKHPGAGGHPCGKGARYILNQWFDLVRFLDHPELRLDNNLAEGDLRMVALIRKNSLFLGSASAGPRAAACLSILRSCRLARINPADYLAEVTPTLIRWRRLRRARLPTPDLAELTPKRWATEHRAVIRSAC